MKYVRIYILVSVIRKIYECRVTKKSTFDEIIPVLLEMIQDELLPYYLFDHEFEVFECFTNTRCDKKTALEFMDVQNGMRFELY